MTHTPSRLLIPVLVATLTAGAMAQVQIAEFNAPTSGDRFGAFMGGGGFDANGDGCSDLLVGNLFRDIHVVSGADGTSLYTYNEPGSDFGRWMTGLSDLNGDGHDEFAISGRSYNGVVSNSGRVWVYSGIDGTTLFTLDGDADDRSLGRAVSDGGDIDGDGTRDILVNSFQQNPVSALRVTAYSGVDGSFIMKVLDPTGAVQSAFGAVLAGLGDINGDGKGDFIVGDPNDISLAQFAGAYRVYSGADGSVLFQDFGTLANETLGSSLSGGDINGDGTGDFVVGSRNVANAGRIQAFSGVDGTQILDVVGSIGGGSLGFSVATLDYNGDGFDDVASQINIGGGRIEIYSGRDGSVLFSLTSPGTGLLGFPQVFAGDVNGDGCPDLASGDAEFNSFDGHVLVHSLTDAHFAGTGEDFEMTTGVNGAPDDCAVKQLHLGDVLAVNIDSPLGTFSAWPPVLMVQFFDTGNPAPNIGGAFPEIWLDVFLPSPPAVIYDGTTAPFGTGAIPPSGINLGYLAGPLPAATSMMIQAFSLAGAVAANGILATSDAQEIRFM